MNVVMLKDVENVGMSGQIVKVTEGHAKNFLIPRGLAREVKDSEMSFYQGKLAQKKVADEVLKSKVAMLAERIKNMVLTIKKTVHDNGKLYGSITADEIVELLKAQEVSVEKKQIEFEKTIKATGDHLVTIKLTSKLKPKVTLKVAGE